MAYFRKPNTSEKTANPKDPLGLKSIDPRLVSGDRISLKELKALQSKKSSNSNNTAPKPKTVAQKDNGPPNKHGAKKVVHDGITFDSILEGKRYLILKSRVKSGEISELRIQEPYDIIINDQKVCCYFADFVYKRKGESVDVIEDVKGRRLPMYMLKKKLLKAVYNLTIQEINKGNITA